MSLLDNVNFWMQLDGSTNKKRDELVTFGGPTRSTKTAKEFLGSGNLEVTWGDNLKTKHLFEVNFEE